MKTKPEKSQDSIAGYHDLVRREVVQLIPKGTSSLLDVGGGIGATA